jgi:hypothetical protein
MKMPKDAENRIDREVQQACLRMLKAIRGARKPGDYAFTSVRGRLL